MSVEKGTETYNNSNIKNLWVSKSIFEEIQKKEVRITVNQDFLKLPVLMKWRLYNNYLPESLIELLNIIKESGEDWIQSIIWELRVVKEHTSPDIMKSLHTLIKYLENKEYANEIVSLYDSKEFYTENFKLSNDLTKNYFKVDCPYLSILSDLKNNPDSKVLRNFSHLRMTQEEFRSHTDTLLNALLYVFMSSNRFIFSDFVSSNAFTWLKEYRSTTEKVNDKEILRKISPSDINWAWYQCTIFLSKLSIEELDGIHQKVIDKRFSSFADFQMRFIEEYWTQDRLSS